MIICQLKTCTSLFYLYRVDHLYTFFVQWSPEIYAKGNKKQHKPHYFIREKHQKHYLVVEKKKVAVINKLLSNPVIPTATNWEVRCAFKHKLTFFGQRRVFIRPRKYM